MEEKRIKANIEFWDFILRPFSKPVTGFLMKTKITPNQVTFFSFLIAIAAAIFIFLGGYDNLIVGGILIFVFMLLDNVDGEIARLKWKTSKLGHWLDGIAGFISNELLIIAIAISINTKLSLTLGILTSIAFPLQYLFIYFYKAEVINDNKPIEVKSIGKLNKLKYFYGSTFFQFMIALGCLFNKTLWVLAFFAVFGNLFWMGTLIVQFLDLKKTKNVMVFGCFDGFHYGHYRLIERASKFGKVTVAVFSDKCMIKQKKKKPTENQIERLKKILKTKKVERAIIIKDINDRKTCLKEYNIDIIIVGDDWKNKEPYKSLEKEYEVIYLPRTKGISSELIRKIK